MNQEATRESATEEHRAKCTEKLNGISRTERFKPRIDQLLLDIENGDVKMKVYKQMKMYNDESLNPIPLSKI